MIPPPIEDRPTPCIPGGGDLENRRHWRGVQDSSPSAQRDQLELARRHSQLEVGEDQIPTK
jgi:hypothetical protein